MSTLPFPLYAAASKGWADFDLPEVEVDPEWEDAMEKGQVPAPSDELFDRVEKHGDPERDPAAYQLQHPGLKSKKVARANALMAMLSPRERADAKYKAQRRIESGRAALPNPRIKSDTPVVRRTAEEIRASKTPKHDALLAKHADMDAVRAFVKSRVDGKAQAGSTYIKKPFGAAKTKRVLDNLLSRRMDFKKPSGEANFDIELLTEEEWVALNSLPTGAPLKEMFGNGKSGLVTRANKTPLANYAFIQQLKQKVSPVSGRPDLAPGGATATKPSRAGGERGRGPLETRAWRAAQMRVAQKDKNGRIVCPYCTKPITFDKVQDDPDAPQVEKIDPSGSYEDPGNIIWAHRHDNQKRGKGKYKPVRDDLTAFEAIVLYLKTKPELAAKLEKRFKRSWGAEYAKAVASLKVKGLL